MAFNLITWADRSGWVIPLRTSEPPAPFPIPAVQRGSAGPNFPPENTNASSVQLLPAEPFVSGLNYPVREAFHLDPSLLLFITDGAWLHCQCRGNSFCRGDWKSKYMSMVWSLTSHPVTSSSIKLSKAIQFPPGPAQACSSCFFSLQYTTPFQVGLKQFLASFLLSLL